MARKKKTKSQLIREQIRREKRKEKLAGSKIGKFRSKKRKKSPRSQLKKSLNDRVPAKRKGKTKMAPTLSQKLIKAVGGRKASVQLPILGKEWYDMNGRPSYTPQSIKASMSQSEMNKEYSRLRSVARKRLDRLGKSDLFSNSEVYKYYKNRFKQIKQFENAEVSAQTMTDLLRFLSSDLSTIKGQNKLRNQRIMTLRSYNLEVNDANFEMITDVMEYLRAEYNDLFFDSDQLIQKSIDVINQIIKDPNLDLSNMTVAEVGDEIYERYSASSSDLWKLSQ